MFSPSSKARLTEHDLDRFQGETLFDRIARATCEAGCLPRKELYEAWEVARRVRRVFRGGRIIDLAAGHGLLAQILLILDDSSPAAVAVDTVLPASCARLHDSLARTWPRLQSRVTFVASSLDSIELHADDVVVSSHACGALTDVVIDRAIAARARVAVLPCCHVLKANDQSALSGWVDGTLAIDIMRVVKLEQNGYHVRTQTIPATVTPKNRLLLATTGIERPGFVAMSATSASRMWDDRAHNLSRRLQNVSTTAAESRALGRTAVNETERRNYL